MNDILLIIAAQGNIETSECHPLSHGETMFIYNCLRLHEHNNERDRGMRETWKSERQGNERDVRIGDTWE